MVSVIIATLGRPGRVEKALRSLVALDPPAREVLVVDGSADASALPVVETWSERLPVRHLRSEAGLTRQRNRGLESAEGEVVLFLDDDATLPVEVLREVEVALREPDVVGVTGLIVEPGAHRVGSKSSRVRRFLPGGGADGGFTRFGFPRRLTSPEVPQDVRHMQGAFMTARRADALAVRFDERLTGYGLAEDEDFSYRLSSRGRIRHLPQIVVEHENDGFLGRDRRAFGRQVVENRLYLFRKNFPQSRRARAEFWGLLLPVLLAHRALNRDWRGMLGLIEGAGAAWRKR